MTTPELDQKIDGMVKKMGNCAQNSKQFCVKCCFCFDRLDVDKSGYLDKAEVTQVFQACGIKGGFEYCDLDRDNKISKEEFLRAIFCVDQDDNLRRIFNSVDTDGSGSVSKSELGAMRSACVASQMEAESLDRIFASMDTDGEGTLSFDEFKNAFFVEF